MATWFLAKIRFTQQDEKGGTKLVNQSYLFDAVSYTDAEVRVYEYISVEIPDFILVGLTKMKFNEVFFIENNAELWFKCRVQYIVFDEKSQREKQVPFMFLLNAHDIKECYGTLIEKLGSVQDYIVSDINVTKILDVIAYTDGEQQQTKNVDLPANLKPISEVLATAVESPVITPEDSMEISTEDTV